MLARCYLGDNAATSRAFIENPTWLPERPPLATRRIYKTGDLVKRNDDGSLTFLGRNDDEIKLRGQRVSIADLNNFFAAQDLVKYAYVYLPSSGYSKGNLTCVVSLNHIASVDGDAQSLALLSGTQKSEAQAKLQVLRQSMSTTFASYMIPTSWILVHDLPLTPSGKIDVVTIRRWVETFNDKAVQEPKTEMELKMQQIWSQVLNVPGGNIGKQSTFLSLGGNSLRAMALTARLRAHGISLPVAEILRHESLEDMAKVAISQDSMTRHDDTDVSLNGPSLSSDVAGQCGISPELIEDIIPAAPFQEALISLTSRDPGAYVVHRRFQISDHVDITRLRAAWLATCRANPVLRTRLVHHQTHGTVQVVVKDGLWWTDLTSSEGDLRQTNDQDFMFGCPLLKLTVSGRLLQVSLHHAIYDGWSVPLIFSDVDKAYATGADVIRPSFKSFVSYLSKLDQAQSKQYWTTRLSNASTTRFPSLPDSSYQPDCTGTVQKAVHLQRENRSSVTTATLAAAAWALVVSRYINSRDVCFGLILSGRFIPVDRAADIIGPLVTTIPMRLQIESGATVCQFLERLQADMVDMMPHVHYGLQNIQDISQGTRTASKFNNTFIVHPPTDGLNASPLLHPESTEEVNPADFRTYPLHVSCSLQAEGGLHAKMRFDPRVIPQNQVEQLMDYFEDVICRTALGEFNETVKDIMRPSDLLSKVLATPTMNEPVVVDKCVHELIEAQAQKHPNAPAICSWDASFSYEELDSLSTRLAQHLTSLGVGPEVHVCFSFEKSSLPLIAIFAILKAGAACVPLDISYPRERLTAVIAKCQSPVVVCSQKQSTRFAGVADILVLDHETLSHLPHKPGPACAFVQPTNAAYTIFTSGSTGTPKGCTWQHSTLSSSAMAHGKAMFIKPDSRVLQFSSFMWDISVCEMITTLIHGGCTCIPSENARLDDTLKTINDMKVTWAWFTPTFARSVDLLEATHLETLVLGGEVIGQDNVDK